MIDAADPLTSLLWVVFFLAAGMYPLGIMLPCSACCGDGGCPRPVPFNRCVRLEYLDYPTPPESYSPEAAVDSAAISLPPRAWSVRIARLSDIGAVRVATKYAVTRSVTIDESAASLADGVSETTTYSWFLSQSATPIGEVRVTLVGSSSGSEPVVSDAPESTANYPVKLVTVFRSMAGSSFKLPSIERTLQPADYDNSQVTCTVSGGTRLTSSVWVRFLPGPNLSLRSHVDVEWATEYISASELRYIIFFQPEWLPSGLPAAVWDYNHDRVEAFLNGEPLTLSPATGLSVRITIASDSTFCGRSVCDNLTSFFSEDIPQRSVTYTSALLPTAEGGLANQCSSQDEPYEITMRLLDSCTYMGRLGTCRGSQRFNDGFEFFGGAAKHPGGALIIQPQASPAWFYCGDLLWSIENGPCRESITIEGDLSRFYSNGGVFDPLPQGTYLLGGDDDSPWKQDNCKSMPGVGQLCPPGEVVAHVPTGDVLDSERFGFGYRVVVNRGAFGGGDVVLSSSVQNYGVAVGVSCNGGTYVGTFYYSANNGTQQPLGLVATIRRENWCATEWESFVSNPYGQIACVASGEYQNSGFPDCKPIATTPQYAEEEYVEDTVAPTKADVPAEGGDIEVTWCCPEEKRTITIPPTTSRNKIYSIAWNKSWFAETYLRPNGYSRNAYITQAANDAACLFAVTWYQSAQTSPIVRADAQQSGAYVYIRASSGCPAYGVVMFAEASPDLAQCGWSVSKTGSGFSADKTDDGSLARITLEDADVASGVLGTVTIAAGAISQTWTVYKQ